MSTITSPDGTVIDYDRYGDGPAVIFGSSKDKHETRHESLLV